MGCDIHWAIEVQTDGRWTEVPYFVEPWHARKEATTVSAKAEWYRYEHATELDAIALPDVFDGRNYDLFGLLADVRNGRGFAGCVTGDAWPALAPSRGLPADTAIAPDRESDDALGLSWLGDHSHTWVSLEELERLDWDHIAHGSQGIADWVEWVRFREAGEASPREYCGGVSGAGVEIIEEDDAVRRLEASERIHNGLHVLCHWGETARQATNDWPGQVLPILRAYAGDRPMRLLMGFDS